MTTLWLTDRSRYQRALGQCDYARMLEYHSGPYGYGIRAKAETVYLPTGIYTHRIVEEACKLAWANDWTPLLPDHRTEVRAIMKGVIERYYALIDARGLRSGGELDTEETLHVLEEQASLIEGLGWTWISCTLPYLTEHFRPVSIEEEETFLLGCTCGLPLNVGDLADHEARGCEGGGWMSKADLVLERLTDGELGWHELKTGSNIHKKEWEKSWDHNVQFASGILGAERRLEREIGHYYLHGLQKGTRRSAYDTVTKKYSGPRRQDSFLCYAYHRPADPPTIPDADWRAKYEWYEYDELTGTEKRRRLGKGYDKVPVWTAEFPQKPAEWSNIEYWCEWLGTDTLSGLIRMTEPYPRPSMLLQEWVQEAAANELAWRRRCWNVYEARQRALERLNQEGMAGTSGTPSATLIDYQPEVRQVLRENFPRNWEGCHGYYGDDCEFLPICLHEPGWDDPIGSGKFVHRRPHHQPEIEQMRERGIPVPTEEDALDHEE